MDMNKILEWFANSPVASALRTFIAVAVGAMISDFAKVGDFNFGDWKSWVIGALVVAIPPMLRWINPQDSAFGNSFMRGG